MAIPSLMPYAVPTEWAANRVDWTLEPARAALLIHDMQDYFLDFWGADSPFVAALVERLAALCAHCRALGIPVIYTAQPGEQAAADRALLNDLWGPGLTRAPTRQGIVAGLAPQAGDTVLTKWRYSAFQRSPLEHLLAELRRDQLIIGGVYGHIGCLMTACDAPPRAPPCREVLSLGSGGAFSREALQARLLSLLDEVDEPFDADANLLDYGLDSIQVMTLLSEWRERGLELTFTDLARTPTLNGWWALIQAQGGAA